MQKVQLKRETIAAARKVISYWNSGGGSKRDLFADFSLMLDLEALERGEVRTPPAPPTAEERIERAMRDPVEQGERIGHLIGLYWRNLHQTWHAPGAVHEVPGEEVGNDPEPLPPEPAAA